jgi:hypothetical protein
VDIIQGIYSAMKMAKITKKSVQYKRQNRSWNKSGYSYS